jgi:hypothetical protein
VRWRILVMVILVAGVAGTLVELLLLGHYEDNWQLIPLVLGALFLLIMLWHWRAPSRRTVQGARIIAGLATLSAAVGIYLHYQANVEWELETTPELHGLELFREAVTGALPLLAPGTMLQLGLLGLLWTHRHPLLATTATGAPDTSED